MKHASLFSGVGGFDLAAQWAGWENVFACEIDKFCQHVLRANFPQTTIHEDVRATDFSIYRGRIDVLTGGFPCQPYSLAGMRKGKDDERHLWPEMLRAIREISPRWVVGENVFGLVSWSGGLVFEEVQADLEAAGYEVQTYVLPACSVDAPHRRDRVWIVGFNAGRPVVHAGFNDDVRNHGAKGRGIGMGVDGHLLAQAGREQGADDAYASGNDAADAHGAGREKQHTSTEPSRQGHGGGQTGGHWRNFPAQSPIRGGDDGLSDGLVRARLRDAGDGIIEEKEIHSIMAKAAKAWASETIKAYGNAVVPQLVLRIFETINKYEKL
jgi:DNA (cytosine-5)-methyltransferase 1